MAELTIASKWKTSSSLARTCRPMLAMSKPYIIPHRTAISALSMPETAFAHLPITLALLVFEIIILKKAISPSKCETLKPSHNPSGTLRDIELVLQFYEGALRDVSAFGAFETAFEQAWTGDLANMAERPLVYPGITELKIFVSNPSAAFALLQPVLERCNLLPYTTATCFRESTGLTGKLWPKDF
jgi:hypothetical protein